jgi:hypothetical protein
MVEADLAELVDHDSSVGHVRLLQQVLEQRRLAGPRKPVMTETGNRSSSGASLMTAPQARARRRPCRA